MKEVIIRLNSDHIKVKGGEYVRDLVRCKDCHISAIETDYDDNSNYRWCSWIGHEVSDEGFCSWGERDE